MKDYLIEKTSYEKRSFLYALDILKKHGIEPKNYESYNEFIASLEELVSSIYSNRYVMAEPFALSEFYGVTLLELYAVGKESDLVERWTRELKGVKHGAQ